MTGWESFFGAQVGASAALAGLIFVGISINLTRILSLPGAISNRGLQSLALLMAILVVSSLMLLPGQPLTAAGVEALLVALAAWGIVTLIDIRARHSIPEGFGRTFALNTVLNQIAGLLYVAGGILVIAQGAAGLYWLAAAILFAYIKAIEDAWVLLVEINR